MEKLKRIARTSIVQQYQEIVGPDGVPVVESVRVPTINKTSIYHESRSPWLTESLTERALHSLSPVQAVWKCGPFPQHERFNAQNRYLILSYVMRQYNINIDNFHTHSLEVLCNVAIKLSNAGFTMLAELGSKSQPRIPVSPSLLMEFMLGAHFTLFNGLHQVAVEAVKAVHKRSCYELFSDVLLMTSAILNSHLEDHLHLENDNISLGVHKTAHVLKNSVTNASFKAKKLPDDIDIVEDTQQRLPAICEEQEYSLAKGLKSRLMTFGGKFGVDKNRHREIVRQDSDGSSPKLGSRAEFADAVGISVQSPGSGKVFVDALEMVPQRAKGNGRGGDSSSTDSKDSHGKSSIDGKQIKISPATIVFSRKSGILKQIPHGASGPGGKHSESSYKVPQSHTALSSTTSQTQTVSSSPSTHSINGKLPSSGSHSNISNSTRQQSGMTNRTNSLETAHPESPSQNESGSLSVRSPPSCPSFSLTFPNIKDFKSHNSSDPLLVQHSLRSSQPLTSVKSHSVEGALIKGKKHAQKSHINKTSFSTDL